MYHQPWLEQTCRYVRCRGFALTRKVGIIDSDIATARIVEDLQLGLICLGNVGKVLVIVGVHVLGICLSRLVAQVVPLRCRQGDLRLLDVLGWEELLQVVPLVDVGAADVPQLPHADDRLAWLVAGLS